VRAAAGLFYSVIPPEVTGDPLRYDGLQTVDLSSIGQISSLLSRRRSTRAWRTRPYASNIRSARR
jgi:hypothetical protein